MRLSDIDWELLLKAYMRRIVDFEGTDFMRGYPLSGFPEGDLNRTEYALLLAMAEELFRESGA